jgi:hypothetical protein
VPCSHAEPSLLPFVAFGTVAGHAQSSSVDQPNGTDDVESVPAQPVTS